MRVLTFGVSGQDGFYLSQICRRKTIEMIGVSRSEGDWIRGNVGDFGLVESLMKRHKPDYIFHFAANSSVSHEAIFENHEAISTGTVNILESVRRHSPKSKVFLAGSGLQFENIGVPIDEATPFAAKSAYAAARIQSVYAGRYYRDKFGLKVYVGYFFNHDSPLRCNRHINQKIAEFARDIDGKCGEKLGIGDLNARKEFNFAGDLINAAWILVNQNDAFEAVIGSGKAHSVMEWLNACFSEVGADWREFVSPIPDFERDYQILVSNPALIKSMHWQPETSFEEFVKMMLGKYGRNTGYVER